MRTFDKTDKLYFEIDEGKNAGRWQVDLRLSGHVVEDYGADADGNRGVQSDVVDEYEILGLIDPDDNKVAYDKAPKQVQEAAERRIEKI